MSVVGTLVRTDAKLLARDRVALLLTFVLPLVFFTIFAVIFGGMGGSDGGDLRPLGVVAVDEDDSEVSRRLVERLLANEAVEPVEPAVDAEGVSRAEAARDAVRAGDAAAAVIVPAGFEAAFARFWEEPPRVELVFDAANPMARFTVDGLIQAASFQAAPVALMESGFEALGEFGGALTPAQASALEQVRELIERGEREAAAAGVDGDEGGGGAGGGPTALVAVDASAATERDDAASSPSIVDYYAAAIGVMFLLFSMAGAAGTLLDEEERGTLERLLLTGTGIGPVLYARWAFFAAVGAVQLALMFAFAWLVFGVELLHPHVLVGLTLVTLVTAAAASAFALVLATACRTRAQLGGLSTVVILVMSALGGSMMPRFVMPAFLDPVAHLTFNGWALDAYLAVLWQRDPDGTLVDLLASLALPLAVLAAAALGLLLVARRLARRWETV